MGPRERRAFGLLALTAAAAVVMALVPPVAQSPDYHRFADTRTLLGVPNALDVLSNAAFAIAGLLGLAVLRRRPGAVRGHARPWRVLFRGVVAVALGSGWYHLDPTNETLVWDRLPMAVSFMAMVRMLGRRPLAAT